MTGQYKTRTRMKRSAKEMRRRLFAPWNLHEEGTVGVGLKATGGRSETGSKEGGSPVAG